MVWLTIKCNGRFESDTILRNVRYDTASQLWRAVCFHAKVKGSSCNRPLRPKGGAKVKLYSFFDFGASGGRGCSRPRACHLMDPRTSMNWCGKSRPHRDSIPGPNYAQTSYRHSGKRVNLLETCVSFSLHLMWSQTSQMWDLWWTKWHWDQVFCENFRPPLSVSSHQCSIHEFHSSTINAV